MQKGKGGWLSTGSVEPGTIAVPCRDSANSDHKLLSFNYSLFVGIGCTLLSLCQ